MTLNQIKMAIYATFITNYYGFKLTTAKNSQERKKLRVEYANRLLDKLNIKIKIINKTKLPKNGQYLLVSNHRTIIDPLIIEIAMQDSSIFGHWIAKKELYNSLFFGKFTRNAGTILLDREASQMSTFFKDIKERTKDGDSIFIFPEGTRNKSDLAISDFKEGSQIIAIKNRLHILPVYIRSRAENTLLSAIKNSKVERFIEIEFGDIIDYKDRELSLQEAYSRAFNIAQ